VQQLITGGRILLQKPANTEVPHILLNLKVNCFADYRLQPATGLCSELKEWTTCGAFHNVLRDYKHYNKKTKVYTLMELFTATGKLKKVFLTTKDVRCVHHGLHGTHRYDI
jgi:hypothetical protein